jgi:hypothetical protein
VSGVVQRRPSAGGLDPLEEFHMLRRAVAALEDGETLRTLEQRFPPRVIRSARQLAQPRSSCRKA